MAVNLTLLPLTRELNYIWLAHDNISLFTETELWTEIRELPQNEVPVPVACHFKGDIDMRHGNITRDQHHRPLKWTTVFDLLTLNNRDGVRNSHWRNAAAWKYLAEMPSDWKVVLYWH